jgi:hypothetical protein
MIGCPIESNFIHTGKSMKRGFVVCSWAMTLTLCLAGLGLAGLTGCGGSSAPPPPPAASITSFVAGSANITVGNSATLTGVFSNGTGVITPGNIAASSGVAVTVSPAATTTYTLTVTGSTGSPATSTATVTVYPATTITSFVAASNTINLGLSTTLTGVFANGTGVITPGNIAATSGTTVTVSPTATTTYTLTVTNGAGTAVTSTVTVTVNIPPPTITSFVAALPTIVQGNSTTLTGVFAGGTGVITPGNFTATSGVAVSVSPASTTKYTLTVTNSASVSITASVTVTVNPPPPSITSFVAGNGAIEAGQSDTLTAVFVGGTAVITPGNIAATSGVAVSVTPAATTTYTLTLTPTGGGAALTANETIMVDPAPTITSFAAVPATITSGQSSTLTGVFANGTGAITPGNLTVTSGTGVSVSPTTTTTYTLTVTPPIGPAITSTTTVTVASAVTVDESTKGAAVTDQLIGMNMAMWYDPTIPTIQTGFASIGVTAVRWPGGSNSDLYNWETNTECNGYSTPNSNFTTFVNDFVLPAKVDLALTADYGTGKNCTGPGDPTEASAWVTNALSLGVTVSHMTVGNEEYGHWEVDNHTLTNDPTTYAAAVAGASGYYALIKAASPSTLVGVDVDAGSTIANDTTNNWDPIVMKGAPFDFVEFHYYPQNPGDESDTVLVQQAAQGLTTGINTIRTELAAAGKPADTPIYVGEMGSVSSNPGKQSWSITQGLYAGQLLGEMMNDGVSRATWWIGWDNCNGTGSTSDPANMSASLYGWQDFGAYNVFSDGSADTACPGAGPIGTLSPTAVAYQLFSKVALNGENALTATVAGDSTDVRAYAATNNGGTALVLFNLNETTPQSVLVTLSGQASSTGVTMMTYDKAIYDLSGSPTGTFPDPNGTSTWAPPTTTSLGAQTLPMTLTLSPWSMNVVIIK